jgi:hypothetical protein
MLGMTGRALAISKDKYLYLYKSKHACKILQSNNTPENTHTHTHTHTDTHTLAVKSLSVFAHSACVMTFLSLPLWSANQMWLGQRQHRALSGRDAQCVGVMLFSFLWR